MAMRVPFNRMLLALAAGWLMLSEVPASAQLGDRPQLPECPTDRNARWDMCNGRQTYSDGSSYSGEFRNNRRHGYGVYSHPNGERYRGEWIDGVSEGQGVQTYSNGSTYYGAFRNNQRHGHGMEDQINGERYTGEFRDGKRHGQGSFFSREPERRLLQNGIWRNGEFVQANNLANPVLAAQGSPSRPAR